ncbi:helix-turn-helix domain-containing protein [Curvibacter lanceolatus]|uniref:helix-turn-helix domain-containing protein n=1 Tax=Curvibacter lanceolatus TaxID=86182 RepID=UPI00037534E1|nr:helix-turn-helix transcriptional regulator [Curvibacter lanceolatus]
MSSAKVIHNKLPAALKAARAARGLTQEDFGLVSSRTYLSVLERGIQSPTLAKLELLAQTLKIHPLTLLTMAYAESARPEDVQKTQQLVLREISELG